MGRMRMREKRSSALFVKKVSRRTNVPPKSYSSEKGLTNSRKGGRGHDFTRIAVKEGQLLFVRAWIQRALLSRVGRTLAPKRPLRTPEEGESE